MTTIQRTSSSGAVSGVDNPRTQAVAAEDLNLAPPPDGPVPSDDLQTALAVLMIQCSREQRSMSDEQRALAAKTQEEAHGRKIEKLREIAEETFAQGLTDGLFQIGAAALQGRSAVVGYTAASEDLDAKQADGGGAKTLARELSAKSAALSRDGKLLDAAARGVSAAGGILSAALKSGIEHDRADLAVIERDVDRARSSVEGAASDSKRAQDEIRETMGFIRQYLATKAQLNQASVIRG